MGWQLRRGLLNAPDGEMPGSPWWRAVNERLLRDTAEARGHALGLGGPTSSWSATCCKEFAQRPSARTWYRAHNASVVAAYLEHRDLAERETHPERFFINLILLRVLFAHALVAAPRLAPRPERDPGLDKLVCRDGVARPKVSSFPLLARRKLLKPEAGKRQGLRLRYWVFVRHRGGSGSGANRVERRT